MCNKIQINFEFTKWLKWKIHYKILHLWKFASHHNILIQFSDFNSKWKTNYNFIFKLWCAPSRSDNHSQNESHNWQRFTQYWIEKLNRWAPTKMNKPSFSVQDSIGPHCSFSYVMDSGSSYTEAFCLIRREEL